MVEVPEVVVAVVGVGGVTVEESCSFCLWVYRDVHTWYPAFLLHHKRLWEGGPTWSAPEVPVVPERAGRAPVVRAVTVCTKELPLEGVETGANT